MLCASSNQLVLQTSNFAPATARDDASTRGQIFAYYMDMHGKSPAILLAGLDSLPLGTVQRLQERFQSLVGIIEQLEEKVQGLEAEDAEQDSKMVKMADCMRGT